jgi:hypothetical protein
MSARDDAGGGEKEDHDLHQGEDCQIPIPFTDEKWKDGEIADNGQRTENGNGEDIQDIAMMKVKYP